MGPDLDAAKRPGIRPTIAGGSFDISISSLVPIVGHEHPGP